MYLDSTILSNDNIKIFNENIIPNNGEMTLDRNSTGIGLTINKKELKKLII